MSGLSYFALQIQSWFFKTQSSPTTVQNFFNALFKSKSPKILKMQLFHNKMPHFFSINSIQIRSCS